MTLLAWRDEFAWQGGYVGQSENNQIVLDYRGIVGDNVTAPPGKNSNIVTPANEFSREIGAKRFKKFVPIT